MSAEREMTLVEWCAGLPTSHLVNKELESLQAEVNRLREALEKIVGCKYAVGRSDRIAEMMYEIANSAIELEKKR